ncbi:molybdenum cofactor guanylyltransferase [Thermomicrobium sp. 4228-Ro]|uniref:molybdenum cofactor guanylyltransferase n=1 Tax=Thermomicrobium sp. 4228-Ro TaxID=2993937 RepID=UPI0022494EA8|nr:molybdenum cofactor guanylyltransferase [Thermomicrobium sp. 4228-Ro]MCX2726500.1 molybdenum cofactor guanylyltransferase [Thermomicrobium sp. 4228-Ro]
MQASIALLAGGQSRRMGRDKALLDFLGEPLLARMIRRVRPLTDDLFIVASDRPEYEQFGVPVVPDRFPGCGPLGGIDTALHAARHDYCLVLSCDLPFVNPRLLAALLAIPRDYDVLVPVRSIRTDQGGDETFETLHAVYAKTCIPAIERCLAESRYKIVSFFSSVRVQRVEEAFVRWYDPDLLSFLNANTPEAYAQALALARRVLDRGGGDVP